MSSRCYVCPAALLLLSLSSCAIHPDGPAACKNSPPPDVHATMQKYDVPPGGEVLPPPKDVAQAATAKNAPPTYPSAPAASADDSLKLMANIAETQDKIQERLDQANAHLASFEAAQQITVQQSADTNKRIGNVERQVQENQENLEAARHEFASRMTELEGRIASGTPAQSTAHSAPQTRPVPAPQTSAPAAPAATVVDTKVPHPQTRVSEVSAPKEGGHGFLDGYLGEYERVRVGPQSKFTPFSQELRKHARQAYERVLAMYPETESAFNAGLGLAALAEQEDDWNTAAKAYRDAFTNFPDLPDAVNARMGLARALMASGKFDEARKTCLDIADLYPKTPHESPALLLAADCLLKSGNSTDAMKEYRNIERTQPDTLYAQQSQEHIGDILARARNYPDAIVAYKKAAGINDQNSHILLKLASTHISAGQFATAREVLTGMLEPQNDEQVRGLAQLILARSYEDEGDLLNAARAYTSAADKYPSSSFALDARLKGAQNYASMELMEHAEAQCETLLQALKGAPYSVREKYEPAALYMEIKILRPSEKRDVVAAKIAQLQHDWPASAPAADVAIDDAENLEHAGKTAEAVAMLKEIARAHPNTHTADEAILKIAKIQEHSKEPARGAQLYAELLHYISDKDQGAQIRLRRALLLADQGQNDEAANVFREISDDADSPKPVASLAVYQLAVISQKLGNYDDAVRYYEKFLTQSAEQTQKELLDLQSDAKWKIEKLKWLTSINQRKTPVAQLPHAPGPLVRTPGSSGPRQQN